MPTTSSTPPPSPRASRLRRWPPCTRPSPRPSARSSDRKTRMLDVVLILHADHELNASTFAARVTAATLASMYAAITSAIGALSGPLHGGANEQVMRMLLKIGEVDRAPAYIEGALERKERIMGFGHR